METTKIALFKGKQIRKVLYGNEWWFVAEDMEIEDPELATKRTRLLYKLKGYPDDWIEKRMRGIAIREEVIPSCIQKRIEAATTNPTRKRVPGRT